MIRFAALFTQVQGFKYNCKNYHIICHVRFCAAQQYCAEVDFAQHARMHFWICWCTWIPSALIDIYCTLGMPYGHIAM